MIHIARASLLACVALALSAGIMFGFLVGHPQSGTIQLPACATEDSDNCYWDAAQHGNGAGVPFIVIDGEYYYPEVSETDASTQNIAVPKCELWAGESSPVLPDDAVSDLCVTEDGYISSVANPDVLIQLPTLAK